MQNPFLSSATARQNPQRGPFQPLGGDDRWAEDWEAGDVLVDEAKEGEEN